MIQSQRINPATKRQNPNLKPSKKYDQQKMGESIKLFSIKCANQQKEREMIVTKHGKERVGLPKGAHTKHIKTVLCKGRLYSRTGYEQFKVMYQDFLYIFGLTEKLEPILITAYKK